MSGPAPILYVQLTRSLLQAGPSRRFSGVSNAPGSHAEGFVFERHHPLQKTPLNTISTTQTPWAASQTAIRRDSEVDRFRRR
jgi:hypothetical protein